MTEVENCSDITVATKLYHDATFSTFLTDPMPLSEWIYASVGFDGPQPQLFIAPKNCRAHIGDVAEHYLVMNG